MTGFQDESNGSENRTVEKTDERQITPFEIQSFHFGGKYCQKHYFVLNRSWWEEHTLATFSSFYPPIYMSLREGNGPHSRTLAWKIPWTEEPGRLQSMRSLRVGHDWATSLWLFTFMHWRRKRQPTLVFLPRESQGWGSLVGCQLWWVAQSRTWLKQLSSSRSIHVPFCL